MMVFLFGAETVGAIAATFWFAFEDGLNRVLTVGKLSHCLLNLSTVDSLTVSLIILQLSSVRSCAWALFLSLAA